MTISKYRFSLVIGGLSKILQRVIDMIINHTSNGMMKPLKTEMDRNCYESLIIVLETLEKCLTCESKDNTNYDEILNVKLLLPHICQIIGETMYNFFIGVHHCFNYTMFYTSIHMSMKTEGLKSI